MDSEPTRDLSVALFEELQELDRPMALVAFANDKPGSDIERGKKRGCAMSHVAVRATFRCARHHRQDWLLAIECLYLTFLIDAQDNGSVRRGQEPYTNARSRLLSPSDIERLKCPTRVISTESGPLPDIRCSL